MAPVIDSSWNVLFLSYGCYIAMHVGSSDDAVACLFARGFRLVCFISFLFLFLLTFLA
jgi:hypothetical protein